MNKISTLVFIFFITINYCTAQINLNLGIPKDFILTEKAVFFVDKNKGSIETMVSVKEHPISASHNTIENVIYIISHHYIFKADGTSGNILDEYQYADILEKKPGDPIDPNLYYSPKGVNKNGMGLFTFNKEFREISIVQNRQLNQSIKGISSLNSTEIINKYAELANIQPAFLVDFKAKTVKPYKIYDQRETFPGYFSLEGYLMEISAKDKSIIYYDLKTKIKANKEPFTAYNYDLSTVEQLKNKSIFSQTSVSLSDELYAMIVFVNGSAGMERYTLMCNKNTNKIIQFFEDEYVWVIQKNCNKVWHASKKSKKPPMPKTPDYSIPKGLKKKEIKEYTSINAKKSVQFQKDLQEWSKQQMETNIKVVLYNDIELKTPIIEHNSRIGSAGVVYNDRYYLVHEFVGTVLGGYTMYDLSNGKIVYTIDLDF
ncbi:MAG: hypothetical protein COA50_08350 [Flavobacteriaceae bacterium]|nr:hypothetical protein [Sneathiella sp.]PCJ95623.1 MAG: hypothetical protein COA50_08350 [Flavobacteriaceae bacterium]